MYAQTRRHRDFRESVRGTGKGTGIHRHATITLADVRGAPDWGIVRAALDLDEPSLARVRVPGQLASRDTMVPTRRILPTRLGTAAQAAEQISAFLERGDHDGALRVVWQLATDLAAADPALRVSLAVTPPAPTGDSRHDALLAGVVDHALSSAHLPRPHWLDESWRTLVEPWDVEPVPALRAAARAATPGAIVAHGVFLDAAELENR